MRIYKNVLDEGTRDQLQASLVIACFETRSGYADGAFGGGARSQAPVRLRNTDPRVERIQPPTKRRCHGEIDQGNASGQRRPAHERHVQ